MYYLNVFILQLPIQHLDHNNGLSSRGHIEVVIITYEKTHPDNENLKMMRACHVKYYKALIFGSVENTNDQALLRSS